MQAEVAPDIHIDMDSLDAELAGAGDVELFWDESAIDGSAPIEDVVSGEEAMTRSNEEIRELMVREGVLE